MKVKLEKLQSNHNNLRTDTVEGAAIGLPMVGESFRMVSDPIDPKKDGRFIITSPVQGFARIGNAITFVTANSTYRLTVQEEE
jgi:hypothetical protein